MDVDQLSHIHVHMCTYTDCSGIRTIGIPNSLLRMSRHLLEVQINTEVSTINRNTNFLFYKTEIYTKNMNLNIKQ